MGSISNYSAGGRDPTGQKPSPFVGGVGKVGKSEGLQDDIYNSHNSSVIVESTRKGRVLKNEPMQRSSVS